MNKVALLLQNLESGGAERVFVNLANGLRKEGFDVEVLLGRRSGVYFDLLHPDVRVREIGATSYADYMGKLPGVLGGGMYSHVLVAGDIVSAALLSARALWRLPCKVVLTHHYASPPFRSLALLKEDALLHVIHRVFSPNADRIVAVSQGTLAWLRKTAGRALPQAEVIYNPVYDDDIYARSEASLDFPLPVSGRKIMVSIGRLTTQKDQGTLLEAMSTPELRKRAVLFVLGIGPREQELKAQARALGLEDCVRFVGHDPNPYRWLARCDLFVLSSINEGFGNVIVEAMAFGKTVVSTDCPSGPAEILKGGRYGYLCPTRNPNALAAAMLRGLEAPMDPDVIATESRTYHCDNIVRKYATLLRSL